jgi:hypothetical protein
MRPVGHPTRGEPAQTVAGRSARSIAISTPPARYGGAATRRRDDFFLPGHHGRLVGGTGGTRGAPVPSPYPNPAPRHLRAPRTAIIALASHSNPTRAESFVAIRPDPAAASQDDDSNCANRNVWLWIRWYWHWDPRFLDHGRTEVPRRGFEALFQAAMRNIHVPTLLVRGKLSDVVTEEGCRSSSRRSPVRNSSTSEAAPTWRRATRTMPSPRRSSSFSSATSVPAFPIDGRTRHGPTG